MAFIGRFILWSLAIAVLTAVGGFSVLLILYVYVMYKIIEKLCVWLFGTR